MLHPRVARRAPPSEHADDQGIIWVMTFLMSPRYVCL